MAFYKTTVNTAGTLFFFAASHYATVDSNLLQNTGSYNLFVVNRLGGRR